MSALDKLDEPTSNNRYERGFYRTPGGAVSVPHPETGKKVLLGAPSSRAKNHISETFALDKWKLRQCVLGVVELQSRGELPEMPLDPEANGSKEILNSIADDALDAAGATLAASRGTHAHFLSELNDEGARWIDHLAGGEDLGLESELQGAIVGAWQQLIDNNGLDILAVEQQVVSIETGTAGTLDRLVALRNDLHFPMGDGAEVTVPKGTVLVLDVKTSRLRTSGKRNPAISYWSEYAHQILCYATGVPILIDPDDESSQDYFPWPEPPSTEHALIAHLDVHKALETGVMEAQLVYVDLSAGRQQQEAVDAVREARKVRPFSVPTPTVVIPVPEQPLELRVERWLRGRIDTISLRPHAKEMLGTHWPAGVAPPSTDGYDPASVDAIVELLDAVEAQTGIPFGAKDPRTPTTEMRTR